MTDLGRERLPRVLGRAAELKAAKQAGANGNGFTGRNIALVFEKASTRTRCAFEVAAYDQGAHVTYLGPSGSHLGREESVADTARVLGAMFDGIEFRGFGQETVEELARHAGVPVWNGLTDQWHPTQMLADVLTMREHQARPHRGDQLLLRRRRAQQRRPLAADHRGHAGHGRADRRTPRAEPSGSAGGRGPPHGAGKRCPGAGHRRPGQGARRCRLRLHRRVGQHGGGGRGVGPACSAADPLPGHG